MFTSQKKVEVPNNGIALTNAYKDNFGVAEYLTKVKALTDEMSTTDIPLSDDDIVSYILAGLDLDCNHVILAVVIQVELSPS